MQIPLEKIKELQQLYVEEYGLSLSEDDAHQFGSWMLELLQSVYEPDTH